MVKILGKELPQLRNVNFDPDAKLEASRKHTLRIEDHACPRCLTKNLKVLMIEEGKKGWEAQIRCDHCKTSGIINNLGFHLEFIRAEAKK